jgi:uncharacterized protein involved in exopolysaccharide biosynthesis
VSVSIRPQFQEKRVGLTLAEPVLVTLTTPERLFAVVLEKWRVLAAALLIGAAGGIIAGLLLPKWYESTMSFAVIPAEDPNTPTTIDPTISNTALSLFSQVLTSRRVTDEVVSQLDLTKAYGRRTAQEARLQLINHITVLADRKSNLVTVSVEDRVPARATAIAQALGNVGRNVNNGIWSARSTDYRKQLEARMAELNRKVNADEEALRAFRDREHVVDLPEQIRASVGEASYLERMKNERKVNLHFNQGFAGADAPEVRRSQLETGSAQAALSGLVHGSQRAGPLLPLDNVPRLAEENSRLQRQIAGDNYTYELLVKQLEMARATEERPAGRAEPLDAPSESREPVRPYRKALLAEGMFVGLLFGLLLAIWPRTPFTRLKTDLPQTAR